MNRASNELPEKPSTLDDEDDLRALPAAGSHAKPRRLPVWTCIRCGARKHLRGARRG